MNEDEAVREVGERMRRARRDARLTQEALGSKVGVKQSRVSLWEGAKAVPTVRELIKIALVCNTRPETLVAGLVAPTVEQLGLELDPDASTLVTSLVQLLHDRPPAHVPGPPAEERA